MNAPCLHQRQIATSHKQHTGSVTLPPKAGVPTIQRSQKANVRCQATVHNSQRRQRAAVVAHASSLDEGLSTSSSSLLGGSPTQTQNRSSSREAAGNVDDVELTSEADMDYSPLRDALQQGNFQKADDITRANLITLAGPDAEKKGWVYFSEVKFIPSVDLQTIDKLWRAATNNRQGYSVQKEIWMQNRQQWTKFFKQIDWTVGEFGNYRKWPQDFTYDMSAKRGHLPLTNALRGTQLFKAILEHPAFQNAEKMGSNGSTPDWLK